MKNHDSVPGTQGKHSNVNAFLLCTNLPSNHCTKTTRKEETWWCCGIDLEGSGLEKLVYSGELYDQVFPENLSLLREQSLPEFQLLVKLSQEVDNQVAGIQLRATGQKREYR